jgi:hypothetical protein
MLLFQTIIRVFVGPSQVRLILSLKERAEPMTSARNEGSSLPYFVASNLDIGRETSLGDPGNFPGVSKLLRLNPSVGNERRLV